MSEPFTIPPASPDARPLVYRSGNLRREALGRVLAGLADTARASLLQRAREAARKDLGAKASERSVSLLAVDKRNDLLAREHAGDLARALEVVNRPSNDLERRPW